MFSGAYEHTIEDKGRTVIPARFRAMLGENLVITRGLHGCLWVFPAEDWLSIRQKRPPKSLLDEGGLKLERYFIGAASECTPDRQGRIALPQMLLDHAGLKCGDAVVSIGLNDKIEMWGKFRWNQFNAGLTDSVIAELGRAIEELA